METYITKTQEAIDLFEQRKFKESFKIFSSFKRSITKDENKIIKIAYELLCGNSRLYIQLGIDVTKTIEDAKKIIVDKYNL